MEGVKTSPWGCLQKPEYPPWLPAQLVSAERRGRERAVLELGVALSADAGGERAAMSNHCSRVPHS